jgi:hypothetical protein
LWVIESAAGRLQHYHEDELVPQSADVFIEDIEKLDDDTD